MKTKTQKFFFSMQPDAGLNDLICVYASLQKDSKVKTKAIAKHLKRTLPGSIARLLKRSQAKSA